MYNVFLLVISNVNVQLHGYLDQDLKKKRIFRLHNSVDKSVGLQSSLFRVWSPRIENAPKSAIFPMKKCAKFDKSRGQLHSLITYTRLHAA